MATTLTFTSLLTDLSAYLDRGQDATIDPIVNAQLPRLINLAERKIALDLQVEGFQKVVTDTLQTGNPVYAKPDRWRRTISMNIGTGATLNNRAQVLPRSYEWLRTRYPDDTVTGQPKIYAEYDYNHFIFGPTPDAAYPWELVYYEEPPLLDATNQTNWITQLAPNLILYGALVQCEPFLKNDERIPTWKQQYTEFLAAVSQNDLRKIVDRGVTRQDA